MMKVVSKEILGGVLTCLLITFMWCFPLFIFIFAVRTLVLI